MNIVNIVYPGNGWDRAVLEKAPADRLGRAFLVFDVETHELSCIRPGERQIDLGRAEHHLLVWAPMPLLTPDAAARLLQDAERFAERIISGTEITTGPDGVSRGNPNAEARAAASALRRLADADFPITDQVVGREAGEWAAWFPTGAVAERCGLTADSTDHDINAMIEAEYARARAAEPAGMLVITGLPEWFRSQRAALRAELTMRLAEIPAEISALEDEQDALMRRHAAWGMTAREIAARTGTTHPTVGKRIHFQPATLRRYREVATDPATVWQDNGTELTTTFAGSILTVPRGGGEVHVKDFGLEAVGPAQVHPTGIIVHRPRVTAAAVPDVRSWVLTQLRAASSGVVKVGELADAADAAGIARRGTISEVIAQLRSDGLVVSPGYGTYGLTERAASVAAG